MKIALTATLAVAALALGACAESGDSPTRESRFTPDETTTAAPASIEPAAPQESLPPVPADDKSMEERVFLNALKKEGIRISDEEALKTGYVSCQFIREGNSVESLFSEMAADPYNQVLPQISNEDLPFAMGAAVGALCPEFKEVVG